MSSRPGVHRLLSILALVVSHTVPTATSTSDGNVPSLIFQPPVHIKSIAEDASSQTLLVKFSTSISDGAASTTPSTATRYEFVSAIGNGPANPMFHGFHFSRTSHGNFYLGSVGTGGHDLDYERSSQINITVRATNGKMTATGYLLLNVTDVNDNAPRHLRSSQVFSFYENMPTGTVINPRHPWQVRDDDATPQYSQYRLELVEGDHTFFNISNDGYISTTQVLDSEDGVTRSFKIRAIDSAGGSQSLSSITKCSIIVFAYDRNDNLPIFNFPSYTVKVLENATQNSLILELNATDADKVLNDIVFTENEGAFNISTIASTGSTKGEIRLVVKLDREELNVYEFNVTAINSPVNNGVRYRNANTTSTNALVTVHIADVDDNRPTFTRTRAPEVIFTEGGGSVSMANGSELQDPDLLSEHPVGRMRVVIRSSAGIAYPEYGGYCSQKRYSGSGPAVAEPYRNSFAICGVNNAIDLLPVSSVCGQQDRAYLFDLYRIDNTAQPSLQASAPELVGNVLFGFWYRNASNGVLLSRYHGVNRDLSLHVKRSNDELIVKIRYHAASSRMVTTQLAYNIGSSSDNAWHNIMLYIQQGTSGSLSLYFDGVETFSSDFPGQAATLSGTLGDAMPRLLIFGGEDSCSDRVSGAEISQAFQANSVNSAGSATACCAASCGDVLKYDNSLRNVSAKVNCAERSILFEALPSLSNSDSVTYFNQVLQTMRYDNIASEILVPNQTISFSASDTVGFGNEHQLLLRSASVNDARPEIYLADSSTLDFQVSYVEDSNVAVNLMHPLLSSILDKDTCVSEVSYINITITNPGTYDNTLERLMYNSSQMPSSLEIVSSLSGKSLEIRARSGAAPAYEDYLRGIRLLKYISEEDEPVFIQRRIEFTISDGKWTNSPTSSTYMNIIAVNDLPVFKYDTTISGTNYDFAFREGDRTVRLVPDSASLTDSDSPMLMSAQVTLSSSDPNDQLEVTPPVSAVISNTGYQLNAGTGPGGSITFTGPAPIAEFLSELKKVNFSSHADDPLVTQREVTFTVSDGMNTSVPEVVEISFEAVNDIPLVDLNGVGTVGFNYDATFTEEGPCVSLVNNTEAVISDVDNAELLEMSFELSNRLDGFGEQIMVDSSFRLPQGLALLLTRNESNLLLFHITGLGTISNYTSVLRNLVYCNVRNEPNPAERTVSVQVRDTANAKSTVRTARVSIQYANDNDPQVKSVQPSNPSVNENTSPVLLSVIYATDADYGTDGQLSFSIQSIQSRNSSTTTVVDTTSSLLSLIVTENFPGNASLSVANQLDAEQYDQHTVTILVSDAGSTARTATTTIVVNVNDVNDRAPEFAQSVFTGSVIEALDINDEVLRVTAIDADISAQNGIASFTLLNGTDQFSSSTEGIISLRRHLDWTQQSQYIISISVQDGGTPSLSDVATVVVNVLEPPPPCFSTINTNRWVEGTTGRSQNLSSSVRIGCRSRLTQVSSASVDLPRTPSCPTLNLCQHSQRLQSCEVLDSTVYKIMELAQGHFVSHDPAPGDVSCPNTAVELSQTLAPTGAYATLPTNPLPDLSIGNFTISTRFQLKAGSGQQDILFSVTHDKTRRYLVLYFLNKNNENQLVLYTFNQATQSHTNTRVGPINVFDGQYHHLVLQVSNDAIFGNGRMWVYVDCQFIGSEQLSARMAWDTAANVHVGKRDYPNPNTKTFNFDGVVDDIIVQRRIWTDQEMNCMCSDGPTHSCGETLERPSNTEGLTATLSNVGRSLTLTGSSTFDVYERVLQSVVYRYIPPVTQDVTYSVNYTVTVSDNGLISGSNVSTIFIVDNDNQSPTVAVDGTLSTSFIPYDVVTGGAVFIASSLRLYDLDNSNLQSAVVYLSSHSAVEALSIDSSVAASVGITTMMSADFSRITLSTTGGGASLQSFQDALRTVQFEVRSSTASLTSPTVVTFHVSDMGKPGVASANGTGVVNVRIRFANNRAAPQITALVSPLVLTSPSTQLASQAVVSDTDAAPEARSINVQLTNRPAPVVSPITGQACERYAPLLTRTLLCTGRTINVFDLLNPPPVAPALNSPVFVNSSNHDGNVGVFDGLNFHLIVPTSNYNFAGQDVSVYTVSAWFKQGANDEGYILALTDNSGRRIIGIYIRGNVDAVWVYAGLNNDHVTYESVGGWTSNVWHHIMVTYNNTQVCLYIDGVFKGTKKNNPSPGQTPSYIVPNNYRLYLGGRPHQHNPLQSHLKFYGEIAGLHLWFDIDPNTTVKCIRSTCHPSLTVDVNDGITAVYNEATASLLMTGTASTSFSSYQTALRTLRYNNERAVGNRTVTYTIRDESFLSTSTTQIIN